ncbi:MAG: hypothetical protein H6718_08770 [Polyangiaceae bacterium]|nr:hypothetical protein [Myxococcales bacterium]MCB9585477.1 hypothetical protein [Polyangiaceae bacterium]MCB9606507.1 hypothetical protein [Polyangiaceae bacterium]
MRSRQLLGKRELRRALLCALPLGAIAWASEAFAGSYLDRAALIVAHARKEADFLRNHLSDKDLAEYVHEQADSRLSSARHMQVPKQVADAHPHLLMMLEHYERATHAATKGDNAEFFKKQLEAREEERIFRGVLKQLGWDLPSV